MSEKIKAITFDLDDTFWDVKPVLINAEMKTRKFIEDKIGKLEWGSWDCLLYTSPSPRDATLSRMPSSA